VKFDAGWFFLALCVALLLGMLVYVGVLAHGASQQCADAGGVWIRSRCARPMP
jgi:hypothetical protein